MNAVSVKHDIDGNYGKPGQTVITAGRRLAICRSEYLGDWYISWSPRNDNQNAEGPWDEWVALAHAILAVPGVNQ